MPVTYLQSRIITNVGRLLTEKNMLAERLCESAEIDRGNFSKFMHGKRCASLATIGKIAKGLEVDPEQLFLRGNHG